MVSVGEIVTVTPRPLAAAEMLLTTELLPGVAWLDATYQAKRKGQNGLSL